MQLKQHLDLRVSALMLAGQLLRGLPSHWTTHVHPVPPSPDMLQRAVQPVLVQVTVPHPEDRNEAQRVTHDLGSLPAWAPNGAQVKAILQVSLSLVSTRQPAAAAAAFGAEHLSNCWRLC